MLKNFWRRRFYSTNAYFRSNSLFNYSQIHIQCTPVLLRIVKPSKFLIIIYLFFGNRLKIFDSYNVQQIDFNCSISFLPLLWYFIQSYLRYVNVPIFNNQYICIFDTILYSTIITRGESFKNAIKMCLCF